MTARLSIKTRNEILRRLDMIYGIVHRQWDSLEIVKLLNEIQALIETEKEKADG